MSRQIALALTATLAAILLCANALALYEAWPNGPPKDPNYFALAVWLQDPKNAPLYKAIGINLFVGLWKGPTEEQLAALHRAGMPVICSQNEVGLAHRNDPIIVGWLHQDEPDNAQRQPDGSWGPAVDPRIIIQRYQTWKRNDPTRPVYLNLGRGMVDEKWKGRRAKLCWYPEYIRGCDIVSYDIYPVNYYCGQDLSADMLWMVPLGVAKLRAFAGAGKIIWNCIETTRIRQELGKPTPKHIRAEVWMSIIQGSRGIVYFCHVFTPRFIEAGLLADKQIASAVKALNAEVTNLAPVINSPQTVPGVITQVGPDDSPVAVMAKRFRDSIYIIAVATHNRPANARIFIPAKLPGAVRAEVLGERRFARVTRGWLEDSFQGYDVHIYRIPAK